MPNLNHTQLEVGEFYRFIQLATGEFEFSLASPFSMSHYQMAEGRAVKGAGYIGFNENRLRMDMDCYGSISLGVKCDDECVKELENLLGKKVE